MSNLDRFFRSLDDDYRDTEKNEKAKESTLKRFDRVCDIAEKGDTYGRSDLSLDLDSTIDPAKEEKSHFDLWLDEEIISGRIPKPPKGACKPISWISSKPKEKYIHPKMLKKENLPVGTHYFPSEKGMEVSCCSDLGFHIEYNNRDVVYRITIEVVTQVADEWMDITRSVLIDGFSNGIYMQSEESKSGGWHISIEDLNANFLRFKVERIISDFDDNDNSLTIVNTYSTEKSYANTMKTATPYLDNFLKKYDRTPTFAEYANDNIEAAAEYLESMGVDIHSSGLQLSAVVADKIMDMISVSGDRIVGSVFGTVFGDRTPTPYLDEAFDEVKKLGSNGLVVYKPQQPGPSAGWDSQTESPMQNQTPIEYLKERGVQSNGDGSFSISADMSADDLVKKINSTPWIPYSAYTATVYKPQQPCTSAALEATLRQFTDLQELRDCELVKQEVVDQLAPWNKEQIATEQFFKACEELNHDDIMLSIEYFRDNNLNIHTKREDGHTFFSLFCHNVRHTYSTCNKPSIDIFRAFLKIGVDPDEGPDGDYPNCHYSDIIEALQWEIMGDNRRRL